MGVAKMNVINRLHFFAAFCVLLFSPIAGCIGTEEAEEILPIQELEELDGPCLIASQSISQAMTSITVNGEERMFRTVRLNTLGWKSEYSGLAARMFRSEGMYAECCGPQG